MEEGFIFNMVESKFPYLICGEREQKFHPAFDIFLCVKNFLVSIFPEETKPFLFFKICYALNQISFVANLDKFQFLLETSFRSQWSSDYVLNKMKISTKDFMIYKPQ